MGVNFVANHESTERTGNSMDAAKQRSWREICEELLHEKRKENVDRLLEELSEALDRYSRDTGAESGSDGSKP